MAQTEHRCMITVTENSQQYDDRLTSDKIIID